VGGRSDPLPRAGVGRGARAARVGAVWLTGFDPTRAPKVMNLWSADAAPVQGGVVRVVVRLDLKSAE
jgi:hypothetical protein